MRLIGDNFVRRILAVAVTLMFVGAPLVTMALPHVENDLVLEVDLSDLVLREARGYVDAKDWPQLLYDASHAGITTSPVPEDNGTIYEIDVGTEIRTSPAVVDNMMYLATKAGVVHAFNTSTGDEVWTKALGAECNSSPAVAGGLVIVGTKGGMLVALEVGDGDQNWSVDLEASVNASPIVNDNITYVGSIDGKVWARNVSDGGLVWSNTTVAPVRHSPAMSGDVLVVSSDNTLQAFDTSNGDLLWTNTTAGSEISGPMASGGPGTPSSWTAYVTSNDDKLYAFNMSNGFQRWNKDISFRVPLTPTKSGLTVLVSGAQKVMAFNSSNSNWLWNYTVGQNITSSVVTDGDTLLVGTSIGVSAADHAPVAGATEIWSYDLGTEVNTPALAYGRGFVTTRSGTVAAFAHRPTAVIDAVGPDPVPQGAPLTLGGHGTDAAGFTNYRWVSDIDGQIAEGPNKATAKVSTLSRGTHTLYFMVQDDNWTWSVPDTVTATVGHPVDWPTFGQDSHRTKTTDASIPATNGTKWSVDLTGVDIQDIQSSPVIVGNKVFVGTRDFWIHTLDLVTGTEIWSYKTGGSVDSSPAYADGYIYFGSGDSRVYCMDADPLNDGADEGIIDPQDIDYDLVWMFSTNGPIWASPVVVNNVLYITTSPAINDENPNPGRLYAISAPPGGMPTELWHFTLPNNAPSYSSPVVYGELVVFGANDNRVYAVNRFTGEEEWNYTTGDSVQSSPAAADGIIYIGSNDNKVYALHASNGTKAWSRATGDSVSSSPAISDGVVYVGSKDNKLYALDALNGSVLWTYETADRIWSSPAVTKDFVVIGSFDGNLYVINKTTHEVEWKRDIVFVAQSSPAIIEETIVIGGAMGYLYAFGKAPDLAVGNSDIKLSLSTPQVGVNITVSATIRNKGTIGGNGTVSFSDESATINSQFVEIAPGGQVVLNTSWTPGEAGYHKIWVNITGIQPHDSDPGNNYAFKMVDVLGQTEGWRMFHKDEAHTGHLNVPTPNNNKLLWSFDLNGDVRSSPVVADQLLFIGSGDGIYALVENPPSKNGLRYWSNETVPEIKATPAIVSGMVYAAATDGYLYAIDAWSNETVWKADIGADSSSPVVVDNKVFIGNTDGELVALHMGNGTEVWRRPVGGEVIGSPAIFEDAVIVGSANGQDSKVKAFDIDTGTDIWTYSTGFDIHASPAIDENGFVYISDLNGTIYSFEAKPDFKDDGISNLGSYDLIWRYEAGRPIHSTIAISGNNLYLTVGNDTMLSITNTGERSWERQYAVDENKPIYSSPAVAKNKIFVGGDRIYCLDKSSGLEVWNYETLTSVSSSPAITLGKVFIASDSGVLHAFGNITPKSPSAVITSPVDNAQYRNDEEIIFDASGSTDDGVILEYIWDFGDGSLEFGKVMRHSYPLIGNYTVTLTVKDNEEPPLSDTMEITIDIIPNLRPNLSNPQVTPSEGDISTLFNFTVKYSDPDNDPPSEVWLTIGNDRYTMDPIDPTNTDYVSGVYYYCSTRLTSDLHTHTFQASDGVIPALSIQREGPKVWQVGKFVKDEITVIMEYVGQGRLDIELPTFPPPPPEGYAPKDILRITPEDIKEWKWMYLEINGSGRNITEGVLTETLGIFWYNVTWNQFETGANIDEQLQIYEFSINVTSEQTPTLGIFGLFGKPRPPNQLPKIGSVTATPKGPYKVDDSITITVIANDTDNDTLSYRFNWDDGTPPTDWSLENVAKNKYKKGSTYIVRVYVTDVKDPALNQQAAENRTTSKEIKIVVREEGSSEALIALAVIIFVVLAIAFAVPTMGAKDEDEDEEEEGEEEEEKGEEEEEGVLPDEEE